MKTISTTTLFALFFTFPLFSQTFQLTVQNGYGSISAAPGDTIHIWAEEFGAARTFSHWSGDTSFLEMPDEWHTRVIMPAQNVSVTSNTKILPTGTANPLNLENIMGRDTLKRVFSYFPSGMVPKGVCWLWHGTNGSASSWAGQEFEQHQFVRYLVANDWGVIVTESEESTKHKDLNGDGNLRYDYYPDTLNNVDLQNVRAIRDTFIHRGKMSWNTPQASVGFSAGGAFSTLLASVLDWKAAVTHCAPGVEPVIQVTTTPIQFSMNARDNHPDVGLAGNLEAYDNYQYLKDKGQCAQFFLLRSSPTYPERFKRMPGITTTLSYSIHNELVANGCFGPGGYLIKAPSVIEAAVMANPANWPTIISLTPAQQQFVLDQMDVMWSSHHFHTDFMAADFKFIESACASAVGTITPNKAPFLNIFPNPTSDKIYLSENTGQLQVFDLEGKIVLSKNASRASELDVSTLPSGLYFLEIVVNGQRQVAKFVKR
ncbi:MAG: T9SS type A sorting domain-containing protein [Phycisphaerae bacterium]|nr:T9SS type A sorting domain-containing protein [Saprospiraceae bacterium]